MPGTSGPTRPRRCWRSSAFILDRCWAVPWSWRRSLAGPAWVAWRCSLSSPATCRWRRGRCSSSPPASSWPTRWRTLPTACSIHACDEVELVRLSLLAIWLLVALAGPPLLPYDAAAVDGAHRLAPPSLVHLLGTDQFG